MENTEKKNFEKMMKIIVTVVMVLCIAIPVVYSCIKVYNDIENDNYMMFKYDEKLGKTVPVGKDADKWVPAEEYQDNSWTVDFENEIIKTGYDSEPVIMYKGVVDGEERIATKEYWASVALSKQKTQFFGYVYIGD